MVLITGATGLVGAHLAIYLLENDVILRCIYRTEAAIEKTKSLFQSQNKLDLFHKIEWVQADINDISALENAFVGVEYVYHCAALISFDPKDEIKLRKINIEGTANIVNFCLANNVKKLCHVSSISACGDLLDHQKVVDELTEWNPEKPHSYYGISKYGAEIEVFRGQQEGLNIVIVSPGVILADGFQESGSGAIFNKVKSGLNFYTEGSSAFVSVIDVVTIMILLMKSDINGEKFILISENWKYKKLIDKIADCYNVKKPKYKISKLVLNILWRLDWILANIFFQKRRLSKDLSISLLANEQYSNQKIIETLNFKFQCVEAIIEDIIDKNIIPVMDIK